MLKQLINNLVEEKEIKYTYDGHGSIFAGKRLIGQIYVSHSGPDELRILQGMDRSATMSKIYKDLPDLCKELEIDDNYYPRLFSRK